ncbi:hypothetical protein [Myxococcus sp. RHSTA-1-4]|uniref:hypothetical protein n=1 Tax=Myxococcus sp. RHSTA-1-4 TaxID=2874601 RepID=UPI001CBCDAAD|nr:hypothetical protein [Myxococcus sp. RHSTA-1-4]MBZ4416622.1 hypothetical protein [Myxococcus sp. RHSTA-1-4]
MPPQNPPQNAGQGTAWTATQESEATHVSAGYRDALTFVLVPRTSIQFDAPDRTASRQLMNPGSLLIEVPIRGKAMNFEPGVTLECELAWLVKRGNGSARPHFVDGARMVIAQNGTFEIKVNGKPPVLDLVAQQVIEEGTLGYSLTPRFPHAETATFEPAIPFKNHCSISVDKPEGNDCRIGAQVTFTPHFSSALNQADLELRVIELDEGSSEIAFGTAQCAFSHRWGPAALWMFRYNGSVDWAIGFTDDTCERFADVGAEEEGSYEFCWQLWGRSHKDGPQTLLVQDKEFLRLPKPKLEDLRVEYDKSWEGTWEIHGKITGVAPRANLTVEVALVEPPPPTPAATADRRSDSVRVQLQSDGVFEAHLGERHWMPAWTSLSPMAPPAPPKAYAILTLPAAARDGRPGPVAPYLNFDETKYSPYKGEALSWDFDAEWVCSEEATSLVTRPPRPTRRRTGLTPNPAPPVDAGDQKTALSWEDVWRDIIAWEGIVPYMYLDTEGNVTVGAGNLLKYVDPPQGTNGLLAARSHPFRNMDEGRPATVQEIAEAFNKVKVMPWRMNHTAYAQRPKIGLLDADIKELARRRYETEFLPALKKGFPDFETYPRAARRGLVDVTYNVGISVPSTWKKLIAATKARDWQTASVECKTPPQNPDDFRNKWRKELFIYAAKVDWKKPGA